MPVTLGIDFGTTNSALAISEANGARVIAIGNGNSGERTLRSVLFVDEDSKIFVGQEAMSLYLSGGITHGRLLQSLKTVLSQPSYTEAWIYGKKHELIDFIAFILKAMKQRAEQEIGTSITDVVLGRPVVFSDKPKNDELALRRLEEASRRAGFTTIRFQYEPVAAALAYQRTILSGKEEYVLLGDFGGGTSDFTVMRLVGGDEAESVVLTVGGVNIGGDTFDERIMWEKVTPFFGRDVTYRTMTSQTLAIPQYLVRSICQWQQVPFLNSPATLKTIREVKRTASDPAAVERLEALILENSGFFVSQSIERAKKQLSAAFDASIQFETKKLRFQTNVNRQEFEALIADDIQRIDVCVADTVSRSGLAARDIHRVLLTGGSSHVPVIRSSFERKFGAEKIVLLDAFTSVAHGLALSA